ncbi:MAG: hypothetical protein J5I94_09510 [Phaeodactylibacter sp.]|nr:hypothetical protein [Phaeodactylibacter sp.]
MKRCRLSTLFLSFVFICSWSGLRAQPSSGGTPIGLTDAFKEAYGEKQLKAEKIPRLDLKRILREDEEFIGAPRFAAPLEVNYTMENAGEWTELEDGGLLWRLKVRSEGALGLAAFYKDMYLPPGSKLFMYSEDGRQVLGAYTFRNNRPSGQFMTGFIEGETAVIEYYEPAAVRGQGRLQAFRIDHAYDKEKFKAGEQPVEEASLLSFGFGTSLACHRNANCPEGNVWAEQKRSVCRVVMVLAEGTGYCSGTLINNTSEDGTPYILSAYHCQDSYTPIYDLWRFDFSYQSSDCANPATEPVPNSVLGCVRRAGRQENDFLLLEATSDLPASYDVFFSGWNRMPGSPQSGVLLHHPSGDIKKIASYSEASIYNGELAWNPTVTTPANHHFRIEYDEGTFEPGSSGCALFDEEGRLRGQLHGGLNDDCGLASGFFGRLTLSWEGGGSPETRLKDWLDPLDLRVDTLNGIEQPPLGLGSISGIITNEAGVPVAGVEVTLSGSVDASVTTGADGMYQFDDMPFGQPVGIALQKPDDFQNGLSTFDLVLIAKHILGLDLLDTPIKMMAADVNGSRSLTTLDQIGIRKVILGIDLEFSGRPAWQFFPADFQFSNPANPFLNPIPPFFMINNFVDDITDMDFIGVKSGDIDDSADTGGGG